MKRKLLLIVVSALFLISVCACRVEDTNNQIGTAGKDGKFTVAVGIVPQAAFVEAVAGDLIEVVTLVPPGYSPENYQPTMTEMKALSDADIYFTLQMPTEQASILPKVKDFNSDIKIVDLREAVSEVYPLLASSHHHHEDEDDHHDEDESDEAEQTDPHVWLSVKRAVIMVSTIAQELSAIDEDNEQTYMANAADYIAELEALDKELSEMLSGLKSKSFLIYHGAYGYFADDYGLVMAAIETEGKQATAVELQGVIDFAIENNIKTIFYQEEFDDNQAKTVTEEIGGTVKKAAPLSFDYIEELRAFANAIAQTGNLNG